MAVGVALSLESVVTDGLAIVPTVARGAALAVEGVATLGADHGIETGDLVDVYWEGGVRYGVTVGTVSGTSVPLADSGAGDNYPAQGTAITVAPVTELDSDFDGDKLVALAAPSTERATSTSGRPLPVPKTRNSWPTRPTTGPRTPVRPTPGFVRHRRDPHQQR